MVIVQVNAAHPASHDGPMCKARFMYAFFKCVSMWMILSNRYWGHKLRSNELVKFYRIVPEVRSLALRTTYLQRDKLLDYKDIKWIMLKKVLACGRRCCNVGRQRRCRQEKANKKKRRFTLSLWFPVCLWISVWMHMCVFALTYTGWCLWEIECVC